MSASSQEPHSITQPHTANPTHCRLLLLVGVMLIMTAMLVGYGSRRSALDSAADPSPAVAAWRRHRPPIAGAGRHRYQSIPDTAAVDNITGCVSTTTNASDVSASQEIGPPPVTSVLLNGGLGNHMFIYASIYGLTACTHTLSLQRDNAQGTLAKYFTLNATYYEDMHRWVVDNEAVMYSEPVSASVMYSSEVLSWTRAHTRSSTYYRGYYQSYKYFQHARPSILAQFTYSLTGGVADTVRREFLQIRAHFAELLDAGPSDFVYIGVHVRRGDYLQEHFRHFGYRVADASYLRAAMEYFRGRFSGGASGRALVFVVACVDVSWCRGNIDSARYNVWLSGEGRHGAGEDMAILAACNHSLLTVGSYGWWSAYLKPSPDAITVYMGDVATPGSQLYRIFNKTDYYPAHWIPL